MKWKLLSHVRLCDPMDCSPSGSSVHGILQARILECVAIPVSRASSWPRDWTRVSCIAGRFFTICATREAYKNHIKQLLETNTVNSKLSIKLPRLSKLRIKFSGYRRVGLQKVRDLRSNDSWSSFLGQNKRERVHVRYISFSFSKMSQKHRNNFFTHHQGYFDISRNLDVKGVI